MWPFNRNKNKGRSEDHTEIEEELRHYIGIDIAGAFKPLSEILETAVEIVSDEFDETTVRKLAAKIYDEELERYIDSQRSWPKITDCDRLDSAFEELQSIGIIASQNAICCQTCAAAEVWEQVEAKINEGSNVIGMTFYHEQDTESALEGGGIYLSYGAVENTDQAAIKIGDEIRRVLSDHGLMVSWNGELSKRIGVELNWQRRRRDAT